MSAATLPIDVLGLVFAAVQPPSARRRLPEVSKHWNEAFCTSAALNSELRADFARLSQGLSEGSDNTIPPDASAEFDRRCSSLAAWLARRAGLVHSLRIDWPSQDSSVPLSAALQQPMRYLTHLEIMCSDHRLDRYTAYPSLRFADVACLASCQPQLTGLVFGRKPDCMQPANMLQEEPAMTWLSSLQRLQRLQLPGFYLQPATAAALASMTGLSALDVNLDSTAAQRALQAALPPLRGLTSLSAMLPDWRHYPGAEGAAEDAESPLDVCGLPRLATLRLNRGGVRGLSCAAMTWLQLNDTDFEMEDLCGCRRLVGLEGTLYTFNTCLEDYVFDEPGVERELPPGSLPALHTLSLRAVLGDTNYHDPGPLPEELSALTGLTSLTVEGPAVELQTIEQWKEQHYDTLHRYHSTESDSDTLQQESLESHMDAYDPLPMPGSRFCLPHLRELNLLSCGLERVPKFVAGLPELHTLRLNGNIFNKAREAAFFRRLPGPACSSLQRLEMRGCFLPAMPQQLSHLTALTALDLSGSSKLEVRRSDVGIFSRLTNLRELHLAKPPGLIHKRMQWSQESVAALLAVQRACSWLDVCRAMDEQSPQGSERA